MTLLFYFGESNIFYKIPELQISFSCFAYPWA